MVFGRIVASSRPNARLNAAVKDAAPVRVDRLDSLIDFDAEVPSQRIAVYRVPTGCDEGKLLPGRRGGRGQCDAASLRRRTRGINLASAGEASMSRPGRRRCEVSRTRPGHPTGSHPSVDLTNRRAIVRG